MNKIKRIWQFNVVNYLLLTAIFLIPLSFSSHIIYPFSTVKAHLLGLFTFLSSLFFIWGLWKEKTSRLQFNLIQIVLFISLFILTISSILGVDPINSFFGWRYSISIVHLYILSIFSLIIAGLVKRDKSIIPKLLLSSFLSGIIVGLLYYTKFSVRALGGSTIGNNSYLGEYLFFNVLFGFGLFLHYKKYWQKILVGLGLLAILISPVFINKNVLVGKIGLLEAIRNPFLFLGEANGATMGICISVLVAIFLFLMSSKKKILKIVGGLLISVFILGIYFAGQELVNPTSNLHKVYVENKYGNRFIAWDIAKIGWVNSPWLGVGYNNYPYLFEKYFNTDLYREGYKFEILYQPHNVFWEFASNTGVLGLLSFLSLLVVTFLSFYKNSLNKEDKNLSRLYIVLASILFGYFIQNLFVFDTVTTYLMLFLIMGIALGFDHDVGNLRFNNISTKILVILAVSGSFVCVIMLVFSPWKESLTWGKILVEPSGALKYSEGNKNVQKISVMGGVFDSTHVSEKFFFYNKKETSRY